MYAVHVHKMNILITLRRCGESEKQTLHVTQQYITITIWHVSNCDRNKN